jgi:hypothetical protein
MGGILEDFKVDGILKKSNFKKRLIQAHFFLSLSDSDFSLNFANTLLELEINVRDPKKKILSFFFTF